MILIFDFGFKHNSIIYGICDKKLYRLPQIIGLRFYPLKEVPKTKVGNKFGYIVGGSRKSITQIKSMLHFINEKVELINEKDMPF